MNIISLLLVLAAVLLSAGLLNHWARGFRQPDLFLANLAEGVRETSLHAYADAVIGTRFLLVKTGSDAEHVAINTDGDKPLGAVQDEADAVEDRITVFVLGKGHNQLLVAIDAIAKDDYVYTADDGKVQTSPTAAGTYWLVGRALSAATNDGDLIHVETCIPIKVVVLAAFTGPQTADGSDAGTTQTLANALKADLAALDGALAEPALIKVLAP